MAALKAAAATAAAERMAENMVEVLAAALEPHWACTKVVHLEYQMVQCLGTHLGSSMAKHSEQMRERHLVTSKGTHLG